MKSPETTSDTADKAQDLFDKAAAATAEAKNKATELLGQMPGSVKAASDKAVGSFKQLSTTQKVVGGALLAAGLAYLVAPKKKGKAKRKAAALDQLLLFVNDRIEGYKRAVDETKDGDHRAYYKDLVSQSQKFSAELNRYLTREGGERETGTTLKGKLYRKLMDAQAVVTARDEKAILAANIYGEKWAIKAYEKALGRTEVKGDIRAAIFGQYTQSKKTFKKLIEMAEKQ